MRNSLFIGLVLLITGCVNIEESGNTLIKSLLTDKEVYGSYEDLRVTVIVYSNENINNSQVTVWGIKPYRYAYLNSSIIIGLIKGDNELTFDFKTPYCTSGCGGVFPGIYAVNAELIINDESISNNTASIRLIS